MHFLARISFTFIRLNWGLVTPAPAAVVSSKAGLSHLTRLAANAGFQPKTAADLASASAAQGEMQLVQQQAQCDLLIKALTALTARDEIELHHELSASKAILPLPAALTVSTVPAEVIAQRPDIYAAERDVLAASAESNLAQAERGPRITLSGNISASRIEATCSIGPVAITLPLFDGGVRRIAAHIAVEGFEQSFQAIESSYKAGFASLFELEDARRSMINAKNTTIDLQRERIATWIALYRAIGGGWTTA